MNLLTMMTLAMLVPTAGADTENAATWVRVTSDITEIANTPEAVEAVQQRGTIVGSVLVKCKSLKINFTAEGKVIECEGCTFSTWTGLKGTAHSIVFDQSKGILTLTGDDTKPVEFTIRAEGDGEQKLVTKSIQISLPPAKATGTSRGFEYRAYFHGADELIRERSTLELVPDESKPADFSERKFVPDESRAN